MIFKKLQQGEQPAGLIKVLLERTAELGDRDDAAMDLDEFDQEEVEQALIAVATDENEEDIIADSAGESLLTIWQRKGKWDQTLILAMHPSARKFFGTSK